MRTEGDLIEVNKWLSPLSFIYGMGVGMRNRMYELGIKKSRSLSPSSQWAISPWVVPARHHTRNTWCAC